MPIQDAICVIIGGSHAGISAAFALRTEGYLGKIIVIDKDLHLPYHRPPLSKKTLVQAIENGEIDSQQIYLKPEASYAKNNIDLYLGKIVTSIDVNHSRVSVCAISQQHEPNNEHEIIDYTNLILATGARAFVPPIKLPNSEYGIESHPKIHTIRNFQDIVQIHSSLSQLFEGNEKVSAAIIGGGYIGLETAASFKQLGVQTTVIEREARLLARVTSPQMSSFMRKMHQQKGVEIVENTEVTHIKEEANCLLVNCANGAAFEVDIVVIGVGVRVNLELAQAAGIHTENGIVVNQHNQTNIDNIYAIGDCSLHQHARYPHKIRLESVQSAVDQAKVCAKEICSKPNENSVLPWFWSDQYENKLQMVGLSNGYNEIIYREEAELENSLSIWYFRDDELLSLDAVNNTKAYVFATKAIKNLWQLNKQKLADPTIPIGPLLLT